MAGLTLQKKQRQPVCVCVCVCVCVYVPCICYCICICLKGLMQEPGNHTEIGQKKVMCGKLC